MLRILGNGSDAVTIKNHSDKATESNCRNLASSSTILPALPRETSEFKGDRKDQPTRFRRLVMMKAVRRILIATAGTTVLTLGIALLVLPGPAFLVIPAGLGILAIEFAWARRWLRTARGWVQGGDGSTPAHQPSAAGRVWQGLSAFFRITLFITALALLLFTGAALMAVYAVRCFVLRVCRRISRRLRNAVNLLWRCRSLSRINEPSTPQSSFLRTKTTCEV